MCIKLQYATFFYIIIMVNKMIILMHLYILFLKVIYFFLKIFPVKERIVFISRQSNQLTLDFKLLKEEIKKLNKSVEIVTLTKRMEKSTSAVLKNNGMSLKQMYYLATSKICIVDGYNITVSALNHKKNLKVLQLWHSLGAIKKFGHQSLMTDKDKKIAKVMKMHRNYDYINGSSKEMIKYFSKAFNYPKNKLYPLSLPRVDYLIKNEKELKKLALLRYPDFKNKKVILYAPTFRKDDTYKINELIDSIDLKKYALIVKSHPNMKVELPSEVYTCNDFKTIDLIPVCDYLITDYSAVSIEASVLNKPIFIYAYDLDSYSKDPGLNIDLEKEFPGYVFKDSQTLFKTLKKDKYDMKIVEKFKNKYVPKTDGKVTLEIAKFILKEGGISFEKSKS